MLAFASPWLALELSQPEVGKTYNQIESDRMFEIRATSFWHFSCNSSQPFSGPFSLVSCLQNMLKLCLSVSPWRGHTLLSLTLSQRWRPAALKKCHRFGVLWLWDHGRWKFQQPQFSDTRLRSFPVK